MKSQLFCAAALLSLLSSACIDDEGISPLGAGGQGAGGSSDGGSTATGATGGDGGSGPPPSRGNPEDFPTDCLETCEEACEALLQCEGAQSEAFPLGSEECLLRCGAAIDGPFWDDLSGNFRCCASQPECGEVQHCGGWLKHPNVVDSCEQICGCFTSNSLAALNAGHDAPKGYRFAPDLLMAEPQTSGLSLTSIPGVHLYRDAPVKTLKLSAQEQPSTIAALQKVARILPTFIDGKGRVAAATGRVVIKVDSAAARLRADRVAKSFGLKLQRKMKLGEVYIYETQDAFRSLDSIAPLNAKAGVRAELDLLRRYELLHTPNDPLFGDQWHLNNTGQRASLTGQDSRVDEAWDITTGDPEVIIAINDDGVDINHPDFAGKLEPELNFPANWEALIDNGSFDTFGWHGTSVAGVAGAQGDNAYMGSGVCSDCRILPHLLGPNAGGGGFQVSATEIADGFVNQVDAGAWIISNSWGASTGDPLYVDNPVNLPPVPGVVADAFDYAETNGRGGLGTVILFASGNSNDAIDPEASYATNLAVGAVDNLGLKSYYSSFGPALDIAAPSNGGLAGITTTASLDKFTNDFGGTSSACPFAAGVVGLVMSANKTLTAAEVRDIVTSTAKQIDPIFGGWNGDTSEAYGHGLVNAYAAVQVATGACVDPTNCLAPSDQCGGSCDRGPCELCRVNDDCAANHVCQAMPSLGITTCVPENEGAVPCPPDTIERNGYCLPTLQACGLCGQNESCNGQDDECDGEVDDDEACGESSPRCFPEGVGCADGRTCVASYCLPECTMDDDCTEAQSCLEAKTQYGPASGARACITAGGNASQCALGCEVVASSVDDALQAEFTDCGENASCATAFGCFQLLPISF